jgi:hypothetical protein
VQAEKFKNMLESLDELVMVRLEYEEQEARGRATDLVFGDSEGSPEGDSNEALAEAYRAEFFEETEPWIYMWAVKTHAGAGAAALRWLETLTPPSFPRVSIGWKEEVIRFQVGDLLSQLRAIGEIPGLLHKASPRFGPFLVRALLLFQAFSELLPDLSWRDLVQEFGEPIDRNRDTFGISWKSVWGDYSLLAELIADQLVHRMDTSQSIQVKAIPLPPRTVSKPTIGNEPSMADLLQGQTAIMAHMMELGKVVSDIEKKLRAESAGLNEMPLSDLISAGESERLEFKASLRWDYKNKNVNKELTREVAIAMAGMLNKRGGTVLIGVEDNGQVCGIEQDWTTLQRQDQDGYGQAVSDTISTFIGPQFADLVQTTFERWSEKVVCRISIKASPLPVFLKGKDDRGEFHLRSHNTTRILDSQQTQSYIQLRWRSRD